MKFHSPLQKSASAPKITKEMHSRGLALPEKLLVKPTINVFVIVKKKNGVSRHYNRGRTAGLQATGKKL